jgi:hypothetical protein
MMSTTTAFNPAVPPTPTLHHPYARNPPQSPIVLWGDMPSDSSDSSDTDDDERDMYTWRHTGHCSLVDAPSSSEAGKRASPLAAGDGWHRHLPVAGQGAPSPSTLLAESEGPSVECCHSHNRTSVLRHLVSRHVSNATSSNAVSAGHEAAVLDDATDEQERTLRTQARVGCAVCGCSREFDADGERICFCNDCRAGGCVHLNDVGRVVHPKNTCTRCGCSSELEGCHGDGGNNECTCFSDACRDDGCVHWGHTGWWNCARCGCSSNVLCACVECRGGGCVQGVPPIHVCARCGCTSEIDANGERVCFCDDCREHGCEYIGECCTHADGEGFFRRVLPPGEDNGVECMHRPQDPTESCTRCGCSGEFDADGERVCFCDDCRESGCTFNGEEEVVEVQDDTAMRPRVRAAEAGAALIEWMGWADPYSGNRDGECSVCAETTRLFPAVAAPSAEQWAQKAQCREPHLYCSDCLTAWIASALDDQTTRLR